jgi:hypothetical protein
MLSTLGGAATTMKKISLRRATNPHVGSRFTDMQGRRMLHPFILNMDNGWSSSLSAFFKPTKQLAVARTSYRFGGGGLEKSFLLLGNEG